MTRELEDQYLKVEPETNVSIAELGLDPGYIAVENGILDLERAEIIRELTPEDYAITQVPWPYDPDATCPRWRRFIRESVEVGKHEALQEFVGYCLLRGEMPYAKALLLVGDGRNGKSTFLDTVHELLGRDNVMSASLNKLAGSRFSAYRLEGKLANINADIEGGRIDEISMFKNMTGRDSFEVEQKYGDPRDLKPSAKLLFAANEVPDADTDQDAFFRRWVLVEFPHTFTETHLDDGNPDLDPDLRDELEGEMDGILVWAIEGLRRLQDQGHFTNAGTTAEVRAQWEDWNDPVDVFIRENVAYAPSSPPLPSKTLYEAYERFMEDIPSSPVSDKKLVQEVKRRFSDDPLNHNRHRDANNNQFRGFGNLELIERAADSD